MADAARKFEEASAPQEEPRQEAPTGPSDLNEALTGTKSPEETPDASFGALEKKAAQEGMAKLNELGRGMDMGAQEEAKQFSEKTKSWWDRVKGAFKKEGAAPEKGEGEIMSEVAKADAVYAAFKAKYDEIMSSGEEAGLRSLERSLSKAYDELAPQVAAEGAADSKAMRQALKTQEMPAASVAGAKLNDVARRLSEVRGRLSGEAPKASARPVETALEAAKPEVQEATAGSSQAEAPNEAAADKKESAAVEKLRKDSKGTPGEAMVDEYLEALKMKSDKYGDVVGASFDAGKGEIQIKYADGTSLRKYASGLVLRVLPGAGMVETIAKPGGPKKEEAAQAEPELDASAAVEPSEAAAEPSEVSDNLELSTIGEATGFDAEPEILESAAAEEEPFSQDELAELKAGGEKLAEEVQVAKSLEGVVSGEIESREPAAEPVEEQSVVIAPEAEAPAPSSEVAADAEMPVEESMIEKEVAAEPPTPAEKYPDLPRPLPGSRPPGVPDSGVPKPEPEAIPEQTPAIEAPKEAEKPEKPRKEKPPSRNRKNEYDLQSLESLKEHLAWRKNRLAKPGRFNDKTEPGRRELAAEKAMIAQMEDSVARRDKAEAKSKPETVAAPKMPEPAEQAAVPVSEPSQEIPAATEEEKADLSSMEFYDPHFGEIASSFLKDPKIDPSAVKTVIRKAKGINALDIAKLLAGTSGFDKDAAPAIAQELLENPGLFAAAREKFVSEVEARLEKKP